MLLRELMSKTDALASAQGDMVNMMQALAASMRTLEERFDRHVADSEDNEDGDDDDDDDEEEEEPVPIVGKGKGRADGKGKGGGAK